MTLFSAIGLAFLGGLILNLMPCVFPVLFLKGLALVNSSHEERRRQRLHGLVYTLGILVSFWIVVAVLLVIAFDRQRAWLGFQLQSPAFVAVLAAMMFFLALSLAGQIRAWTLAHKRRRKPWHKSAALRAASSRGCSRPSSPLHAWDR